MNRPFPACLATFLFTAVLTLAGPAWAQDTTAVPVPSAAAQPDATALPAGGLPAVAEVAAFFDGLMRAHLDAHHGAGAVVAVVRGDSLFFARGYGFADVAARRPVRPDETLFRLASISKLFVWTAVMQLAADGQVDLDADVNTYLEGVQVPATFDEPITLRHLMTHTPGFEDHVIGLFARDPARVRPLAEVLQAEMPVRVRPPGQVASYSNHGTGIAAHVVEQVSGMEWNAYVEERILGPLGMARTTFRQPVPEALMADVSRGYRYAGGAFVEEGFEYIPLTAAGGASATATDLARFMRAHLNLGRLGDAVILDSTTARRMQATLFEPAPGLNGMAHGFIEMDRNGYRVIGHGGALLSFHSVLALLPEEGVGLFVAFNATGGGGAPEEVYEAFMDRFYPAPVPVLVADATARDRLNRYAGAFRSVRYSHTTLARLGAAFGSIDVSVTEDGRLRTEGDETLFWMETGPGTFREEHGQRRLAFREDEEGAVTHLLLGEQPVMAYERVGFVESPALHGWLAVICTLVLVLAVVGWPAAAVVRRRHGVRLEPHEAVPGIARLVAWTAALALATFLGIFVVAMSHPFEIVFGVPAPLRVGLWLPRVAAVFTLLGVLFAAFLWIARRGRGGARFGYTLVVLACGVALWQLYHWRLLTFSW